MLDFNTPWPRSAAVLENSQWAKRRPRGLVFGSNSAWRHAAGVGALTEELEDWLDLHAPHACKETLPAIRVIGRAEAATLRETMPRMSQTTRGLIDAATKTICLVAPCAVAEAPDVSVFPHGLASHRQQGERYWNCPGAPEPEVHELQSNWLAERGLTCNVNVIAVVFKAACNRRDRHPE